MPIYLNEVKQPAQKHFGTQFLSHVIKISLAAKALLFWQQWSKYNFIGILLKK